MYARIFFNANAFGDFYHDISAWSLNFYNEVSKQTFFPTIFQPRSLRLVVELQLLSIQTVYR